jgi:hypothetical protein
MIAFEVSVNDEHLCLAGIADEGVLSTIINYLSGDGTAAPNPLWINVGALSKDEHRTWVHGKPGRPLALGDVVVIRIVQSSEIDEPVDKYPTEAV